MEYQNTKSQAEKANEKASENSLKKLTADAEKAEREKTADPYRLSTYPRRIYMDYAIKYAEQIGSGYGSSQLQDTSKISEKDIPAPTNGEVDLASWLLKNATDYLNGAKIKVKNINNLTTSDKYRIEDLIKDAYTDYSKANKYGFLPAMTFKNRNKTGLTLHMQNSIGSSKYTDIALKYSDFATDKYI